jgi:hypothetical protein
VRDKGFKGSRGLGFQEGIENLRILLESVGEIERMLKGLIKSLGRNA